MLLHSQSAKDCVAYCHGVYYVHALIKPCVHVQGYAFVVFASPAVVSRAIEELDCKAVEGKILAVQRATDGKAACSTGGVSSFPRDAGHTSLNSSSLNMGANSRDAAAGLGLANGPELPSAVQQKYRSSNSSSGSSSAGGASGPHTAPAGLAAAALVAAAAAQTGAGAAAALAVAEPVQQQQQAVVLPHHRRTASGQQGGSSSGPQPPAAAAAAGQVVLPPVEGSTLGQRLLAAVTGGGSSSGGGGSAAAGMKQYDVNELYIGDLPLSWDEDAVRRLLGRYGKIKYFTLRNGRDKNFAFCKFKDSSVVDAAIQGLHGKIVDGYFLNVRRAIEGKQQQGQGQQQPPQQWLNKQAGNRASFDAGGRVAQQRPSDQQQQQQQQPGQGQGQGQQKIGGKVGMHGSRGQGMPAGAGKHGSGEWQQQQQGQQQGVQQQKQLQKAEQSKAAAADAPAAPTQQQQQDDNSSASTAPSPPDTPTAPLTQQQQPAQAVGAASAAADPQQQQQQASLFHPFLPTPAGQQQQQQVPSLFLGSDTSGSASWGAATAPPAAATAAGIGFGLGGFQPQQPPQQQQHSMTWDMLSPWSLFSNTQKSVW
jgi:RNA recognition motif-containing protein